jgi:hypothetical protein
MRTPAGKECKYFYGNYFRGRSHEECRLLLDHNLRWEPRLCERCPVPDFLLANSCEHMVFTPDLQKEFFIGKPQVHVTAFCTKTDQQVSEPRIGCGQCHPVLDNLVIAPDDPDNPS